jgi:hypothetical protein
LSDAEAALNNYGNAIAGDTTKKKVDTAVVTAKTKDTTSKNLFQTFFPKETPERKRPLQSIPRQKIPVFHHGASHAATGKERTIFFLSLYRNC